MKVIFTLFILVTSQFLVLGQCSFVSVVVSASDTSYVQLYHPGFFLIPSGFDNVCEWEISTFSGEIVFQGTSSGNANEQGFVYFEHSVPVTDSMKVHLLITNNLEGITCTITDTLFWEETEIIPGAIFGNWAILSNNGGVEEEITSVFEFESVIENIQLFPSPVDDHFRIKGLDESYNLTIFNLSGQLMESHIDLHPLQKIDVAHLPSGVYFVQFQNKEKLNMGVTRFIKQ